MKPKHIKLGIILGLLFLIGIYFGCGCDRYLSLDYLQNRQVLYQHHVAANPLLAMALYFLVVFLLSALSLPGISLVIMVAGLAFFGFWSTLVIASFADALGSTAAFLTSRYLFAESVQARYPDQLLAINRGVEEDGGFYLFSLRLMFFFPCFMVNLLMGLTSMRTLTFYWVTQIGKLPYKIIFTYTGMQLGEMSTATDLFSPQLVTGFMLIGLFPLIAKKLLHWMKSHKPKAENCPSTE